MIKNVYSPLSGALAQERVLEIIANNLANVSTNGFKGENVSFKLLESEPNTKYKEPIPAANYKVPFDQLLKLHGNELSYVGVSKVSQDFSQGPVVQTRNPLDLMIEGEGFFSVNTNEGIRYTRDGSFSLNPEGALIDKRGNPILGEKGSIYLHGSNININHLGEVYQDNEIVDRIVITNFTDTSQLERRGHNLYLHIGSPEEASVMRHPKVTQGSLEGSNVNAIKNLTNMILAHRSYEAYQKAIKNFDSMMDKSNNSLASLRA